MVVTNPNSASVNADNEGSLVVDESISVETLTVGSLTQHEAAEAIQGLQALAEQGVLEPGTIEEEQIQVRLFEGVAAGIYFSDIYIIFFKLYISAFTISLFKSIFRIIGHR